MTDNTTITEDDDGEELIPVETQPKDAPVAAETDDEDDDDEDERLATSEEDSDEEISSNRKRRQKRREVQKRARDAAREELTFLRKQNEELARRVATVEQHAVGINVNALDERLTKALSDAETAKRIIAAAVEAGNGQDVTQAMEIRDAAMREATRLSDAKAQLEQARQQAAQPQPDPAVASLAREWMAANPWYDPQGRDQDSAVTKQIDQQLAAEGFHPGTRVYWEELTARVAEAINDSAPASKSQAAAPRRKAPPTGSTREHAPTSTRKEIFVTAERKQAMIDAGVWDDPVRRQRILKAYQAYDASSAR